MGGARWGARVRGPASRGFTDQYICGKCYFSRQLNLFFRNKCNLIGNERQQIFIYQLTDLPQFLRFGRVELRYYRSYVHERAPLIERKCQSAVNYLQRLKLNDSNQVHFNGTIDKSNPSNFSDHSQLLDHLRNEFLPICGSSRGYIFEIYCYSKEASHINIIPGILQIPRIECCSNVEIELKGPAIYPIQLPIEPISNWLHRDCNGNEEKSKERFLRIYSLNFPCIRELCDHLKKVTFVIFRKF